MQDRQFNKHIDFIFNVLAFIRILLNIRFYKKEEFEQLFQDIRKDINIA